MLTDCWSLAVRSRRGSVHGNLAARLAALEARSAARHCGPIVGIEIPETGQIKDDTGRLWPDADAFVAATSHGRKTPLLITLDREPSPHNAPEGGPQ